MLKKLVLMLVLGTFGLLIAAYFFAAAFVNHAVKKAIEHFGPLVTGTDVTLDRVALSVLSGSGTLYQFHIGNPDGFQSKRALELLEATVSVRPDSLVSDVIIIDKLQIIGAEATYELGLGSSNIGQIRQNVNDFVEKYAGPSSGNSGGSQKKVIIKDFLFKNCKVKPTAKLLMGQGITVPIPDIHLTSIGEKENGILIAEAIEQISDPIFNNIDVVVAQSKEIFTHAGSVVDSTLDGAKKTAEGVKKTIKDLKGVFKK